MQQITVSNLMRVCPAAVISESALLREAAELLVVHNLSLLVVQDSEGHISGVIPESAVIRQLLQSSDPNEPLRNTISRHVDSVRDDAGLDSILHLFRSSCNAIIPVVNAESVVIGMLYRSDVVGYLLSDIRSDADDQNQQKPHFMKQPTSQKNTNGLNGKGEERA